jgi:hypothetical protein
MRTSKIETLSLSCFLPTSVSLEATLDEGVTNSPQQAGRTRQQGRQATICEISSCHRADNKDNCLLRYEAV